MASLTRNPALSRMCRYPCDWVQSCVSDCGDRFFPLLFGRRLLLCAPLPQAYYLKYQNRRPEYIASWWKTVDFDVIAKNYTAAKSGGLPAFDTPLA